MISHQHVTEQVASRDRLMMTALVRDIAERIYDAVVAVGARA